MGETEYFLVSMALPEMQLKKRSAAPQYGKQLWNYVPTGDLVNGWNVGQTSD